MERLSREFPVSGMVQNGKFREAAARSLLREIVGSNGLRMKACNGLRLLAMDIENRVKFGDLQEVGNFLIQVQEL